MSLTISLITKQILAIKDNDGNDPLHYADTRGHKNVALLLMEGIAIKEKRR